MKKGLIFAFLLMGFTFTVTQGLFIREFLVTFSGNELSIGLILGNWLILEAAGSGLLGRLADRAGGRAWPYAALQLALSLLFFPALYAAYTVRTLVGTVPGEGIGLLPILTSSLLILAPLALVDGAMFTFGCQAFSSLTEEEAPSIGQVYIYEAVGSIVGGIVFTYLFIPYLHSVQMALAMAALNLLSALLLLALSTGRARRFAPMALLLLGVALYLLLSPGANRIHRWVVQRQWAGYNLRHYQNSIYGNVAVIQQEEQYTFFANGIPILTAPVPDITLVEELVHLPMLFHPDPRRVLVVSGGVGGVLNEILKHPVERVDYAELDPLLIEVVQEYTTPLTARELSDPRVRVQHVDGRLLVKKTGWEMRSHPQERYDLIFINLPYPSTLQLNRFYTREFFRMAQGILAEDGILVVGAPGILTYMGPELRDLNVVIYETLAQVFPHVRAIPGDYNLFLASPSDEVSGVTVETLTRRWRERGIETQLLTEFHFQYKFDPRRLDWFWSSLRQGGEVRPNEDLHPSGLFYGLSYWNALFSPRFSGYFQLANRLSLPLLGVPLVLLALAFLALRGLAARLGRAPVSLAIATTGVVGMTIDLVIIFAFQALYGYVYHRIGLLIPAFMAGLSLGGLLMTSRLDRIERERPLLVRLELAVLLYVALLPLALMGLFASSDQPWVFAAVQPLLLILNALGGFLVGLEFPLANKMYLKRREGVTETAGVLYAADLLGAFVGSLGISVVLLPVLGVLETCLLLVALKLVSFALVTAMPNL